MIMYRESTLAKPPTCPKNGDHLWIHPIGAPVMLVLHIVSLGLKIRFDVREFLLTKLRFHWPKKKCPIRF